MEEFGSIKPRKASITDFSEFKRFLISKSNHDTDENTARGLCLSDNSWTMWLLQ
jgi:hypothetical protein